LTQIYGSIEAQHAKTRFLNFADGTDAHGAMARADRLFDSGGVVGGPLGFMTEMFDWLGLNKFEIDPNALTTRPHESDSYYRFKFRHETRTSISAPKRHDIPPRVEEGLRKNFAWFFDKFYPSS